MHYRHLPRLAADLDALLRHAAARRHALRCLAGPAPLALLGCGGGGDGSSSTGGTSATTGTTSNSGSTGSTSCAVIPEETAGPFPGDGTNTANGSVVNALSLSGIVRSDLRSSIGGASGTAAGVPLTLRLKLVSINSSCAGLSGYAVYLWHCDREGRYSLYSAGVSDQNYLRGVQVSDATGELSFTTVFPGCYSGRWPHIHFEVYRSAAAATSGNNDIKTSQLALPAAACSDVYNNGSGYSASITNFAAVSLTSDNVFGNDAALQLATMSGERTNGYNATLQVGVAA